MTDDDSRRERTRFVASEVRVMLLLLVFGELVGISKSLKPSGLPSDLADRSCLGAKGLVIAEGHARHFDEKRPTRGSALRLAGSL